MNIREANIVFLETEELGLASLKEKLGDESRILCFSSPFALYEYALQNPVQVVISSGYMNSASGVSFMDTLRKYIPDLVFIFYYEELDEGTIMRAYEAGVSEVFDNSFTSEEISRRLNYLLSKGSRQFISQTHKKRRKLDLPLYKRVFDIVFAGTLVLVISPLLLFTALLIKLESRGPVIYYSPRVGTGYRIFRFYKFRSMRLNADQQLKNMKHLNQYDLDTEQVTEGVSEKCQYCRQRNLACHSKLFADGREYCENLYQQIEAQEAGSTFIKIKNDPRITRVGRFIRNTSIDELPQLFNVLIGDMSIVGNRPLPLYEAEKLTTDQFAERFHAPAGITGLWQISKRGKGKMTEEERIALDNQYARSYSLWLDLQILFKTFFALLQKENV
jgi:lipopolysaccharide/colanic/teichoic acid biosynthesis glycosyltransferase